MKKSNQSWISCLRVCFSCTSNWIFLCFSCKKPFRLGIVLGPRGNNKLVFMGLFKKKKKASTVCLCSWPSISIKYIHGLVKILLIYQVWSSSSKPVLSHETFLYLLTDLSTLCFLWGLWQKQKQRQSNHHAPKDSTNADLLHGFTN